MTEFLLQEKELKEKVRKVMLAMKEPVEKLRKAKAILEKAKAHFANCLAEVKPLQSDKIMLEGELELIEEKKSKLRQEARFAESGGIRPGTQALVDQMHELVGDPEQAKVREEIKAAQVDDALAAMKAQLGKD